MRVSPIQHVSGRSAFTLVELIVVMVVLGVLAGVAIPILHNHADRARMTAYIAHANRMYTTLSQYEMSYPEDPDAYFNINPSNIASTPLATWFTDNEFSAMNATWTYTVHGANASYDGKARSYLGGNGLARFGEFPVAGHAFMQLAAGTNGVVSASSLPSTVVSSEHWAVVDLPNGQDGVSAPSLNLARAWMR